MREKRQKQAQTLEKALNEIHTIERTQFRRETPSWVRTFVNVELILTISHLLVTFFVVVAVLFSGFCFFHSCRSP